MSGCVTNLFCEEQRNERYKSEGALLKNLKSKQKQDLKSKILKASVNARNTIRLLIQEQRKFLGTELE